MKAKKLRCSPSPSGFFASRDFLRHPKQSTKGFGNLVPRKLMEVSIEYFLQQFRPSTKKLQAGAWSKQRICVTSLLQLKQYHLQVSQDDY